MLETERLILRKPELTDAPDIHRLVNHPTIARNTLSIPYPYPQGAAEEFLREIVLPGWEAGDNFAFAVMCKDSGEFMGIMGIHREQFNRAQMGYWLGEAYWGYGYATEAARRIVQFGFEAMNLNRIYATYFTFNPASRRVMEKAGMTFEGINRQHLCKNGEYIDVGTCAILRSEFEVT